MIKPRPFRTIFLFFLAFTLTGCSTANNKTSVLTISNIGVDLDNAPPRLAMAISSSKGIITPTFEGGQSLPALTGMSTKGTSSSRFFSGLSSTVATGDAAYAMSYLYTDCNAKGKKIPVVPEVKLTRRPRINVRSGDVKPAIIMRTKVKGAMISWSDRIPLIFSSVKIGYNRREEIAAPVHIKYEDEAEIPYTVTTPSFVATTDQATDLKERTKQSPDGSEKPLKYLQFLAIGDSADKLVVRDEIRFALLKRLFPELEIPSCR